MFKSDTKTALQEYRTEVYAEAAQFERGLPKGAGVWDGKYTEEYAELEPEELEALPRQEAGRKGRRRQVWGRRQRVRDQKVRKLQGRQARTEETARRGRGRWHGLPVEAKDECFPSQLLPLIAMALVYSSSLFMHRANHQLSVDAQIGASRWIVSVPLV